VGPGTLTEILASIPQVQDPRLLVSGATMDDAGVYQLSEELALVQTVDFFTPMVDDPYLFGQIAAANALSDVYAMGGVPLTAMNITAFPVNILDLAILREILLGGADKVREAGALLVGGHTVEDPEPKYGLSVTGTVHPKQVLTNRGARPGDVLILTKPLGIGIITTAIKGDLADARAIDQAIRSMAALNKKAAEVVQEVGVHACTDVTGFGLLGHLFEMLTPGVGFQVDWREVPVLEAAYEYAGMGLVPAGARRNFRYLEKVVTWSGKIGDVDLDILCDPQTSGGLLVAVCGEKGPGLVRALRESGVGAAKIIGRVTGDNPGRILVKG
jgi:selenide,water dikinase